MLSVSSDACSTGWCELSHQAVMSHTRKSCAPGQVLSLAVDLTSPLPSASPAPASLGSVRQVQVCRRGPGRAAMGLTCSCSELKRRSSQQLSTSASRAELSALYEPFSQREQSTPRCSAPNYGQAASIRSSFESCWLTGPAALTSRRLQLTCGAEQPASSRAPVSYSLPSDARAWTAWQASWSFKAGA